MNSKMMKQRAVFLDRDGTVNVEKEYLSRIEDFEFIPGSKEAIRRLRDAGFLIVVVTNQSGIGRGYYSEKDLKSLHQFMEDELAKIGAGIDGWYFCPHHPTHGIGEYGLECSCRKPMPGMLLTAAVDLDIDLSASFMVGDKCVDVEAGLRAGCRSILVKTGYGMADSAVLPEGVNVSNDLSDATNLIISTVKV